MDTFITRSFLRLNPDCIFVFGDNNLRQGKGGAAVLRDEPNTYGFITKKAPDFRDKSYYNPSEYLPVYEKEVFLLKEFIKKNSHKTILISKLGSGLANRFHIFELIIQNRLKNDLQGLSNVKFLW